MAGKQQIMNQGVSGKASMVDVGVKPVTRREAVARGLITMKKETLDAILESRIAKGDVIGVARVAGIMAAKETHRLLPLCHPLPLEQVAVDIAAAPERSGLEITAAVRCTAKTGAEMEALTAVAITALAVYDMCKPIDTTMRIEAVRLVRKSGGKSGLVVLE